MRNHLDIAMELGRKQKAEKKKYRNPYGGGMLKLYFYAGYMNQTADDINNIFREFATSIGKAANTIVDAFKRSGIMDEFYWARIGYEAYCEKTDNKSLATGDELPKFDDLPEEIKQAWKAATMAVVDKYARFSGNEMEDRHNNPDDSIDRKFCIHAVSRNSGAVHTDKEAILFLARDAFVIPMIEFYLYQCVAGGADERQIKAVMALKHRVELFQRENGFKVPDVDVGEEDDRLSGDFGNSCMCGDDETPCQCSCDHAPCEHVDKQWLESTAVGKEFGGPDCEYTSDQKMDILVFNRLKAFLYLIMRDLLPAGQVERQVEEVMKMGAKAMNIGFTCEGMELKVERIIGDLATPLPSRVDDSGIDEDDTETI